MVGRGERHRENLWEMELWDVAVRLPKTSRSSTCVFDDTNRNYVHTLKKEKRAHKPPFCIKCEPELSCQSLFPSPSRKTY